MSEIVGNDLSDSGYSTVRKDIDHSVCCTNIITRCLSLIYFYAGNSYESREIILVCVLFDNGVS
jgi:hypothetical protein